MSDHPKEAERNLKRIVIYADLCLDVFRLLPPAKLGLELALVSCRFDDLVDTHFRSRHWALGKLSIVKKSTTNAEAKIIKWNMDGSTETLPIPQTPLPSQVVGFARIVCLYAADDVVDFLQRIGRLLQSDITLDFGFFQDLDAILVENVWPLLNPFVGIVKMRFEYIEFLNHMRFVISPSILCDCANLRVVHFCSTCLLTFPPDDSAEASVGNALCKWLHTPLTDGRPKVLKTHSIVDNTTMEQLKTEFLSASAGVSFIFISAIVVVVLPFGVENSLTNERMTMRQIDHIHWMVVRCPIGKNADQWAEWERDALEEEAVDWKVLEYDA